MDRTSPRLWREKLAALVAEDRWIIDGNYGSSLAMRSARADTLLHLDYSTALCLWRALKRVIGTRGQVRADAAPGCPERFDAAFLAYIALFRARKRSQILRLVDHFDGTILRFSHPVEAERWLSRLASS